MHEEIRYKCEKCKKTLNNKDNLRQHILSIHERKMYQCEKCEKSFNQRSNLKRHVLSFHKGFKVKCPECGQDYCDQNSFQRHFNSIHKGERLLRHGVNAKICQQEGKTKEQKEKSKPSNLPKPKKGMWIVKLEKLTTFETVTFSGIS